MNGFSDVGIPVKVYNPFPGIPLFARKEKILAIDSDPADVPQILKCGKIITPAFTDEMIPQNTKIVSRFIAKVAFESLAQKLNKRNDGFDYLINETMYNPIRNYVRLGNVENWPCNIRRIYDMDKVWQDDMGMQQQIIHESDFLLIPVDESADLLNDNPILACP